MFSCNKNKAGGGDGGEPVEIYLLKTSQLIAGKCQVDPSSAVLADTPAIKNDEILKYSPTTYEFRLSDAAFEKAKSFTDLNTFAVTAGKKVIYYGIVKSSFSSSSCDHSITLGISWSTEKSVMVALGYPGALEGVPIDDQRNNTRLLSALKKQNKLTQ